MKRDLLIAAVLTALVCAISYGAALTGTNIAAPVVPFTDADTYPSHEAKYGKGGYIQAQSTSVTNIPLTRRVDGMMTYATQWNKYYRLASGVWQQQTFIQSPQFINFSAATQTKFNSIPAGPTGSRGYDGWDGDSYFCYIDNGPLSVVFDANGLVPKYDPSPYYGRMTVNGSAALGLSVRWSTYDSANSHVTGSFGGTVTGTQFTPTILAAYSSAKKYNSVWANFSTAKLKCKASIPVVVTKIGATGAKGDPGDLSNLTRLDVTNVLDNASDTAIYVQPATNSGTVPMIGVRDYPGNVRNYIDSSGYQYFKDVNGYALVKIQTDGTLLLLDKPGYPRAQLNNLGRLILKDFANKQRVFINSSTATIQTFRKDGTTIGFQVYSSGRWVGAEGQPASNGQCLAADTNGRRYWTNCGSGGGTPGGTTKQVQYNNGGSFAGFGRYSANAGALIIQQLVIQ